MNYPHNIESKIGFDVFRDILETYCSSELGKTHVHAMSFSHIYAEILTALHETTEMVHILKEHDSFPTPSFVHIKPILLHLQTEGSYIPVEQIPKLIQSLQDIQELITFLENHTHICSNLHTRSHTVSVPNNVIHSCRAILNTAGEIKDNATKELAEIRLKMQAKKKTLQSKITHILKTAKNEGLTEENTEISIRNGRYVIPIYSSHKRKLRGLVHDESATGKTSFVEPLETFELHNEIANLEIKEQSEILKILHNLTHTIRPYIPEIAVAYDFLGFIDFIIAKAKLAIRLDANMPKLQQKPCVDLYAAKHPLLQISYENTQKTVIPLRIRLDSKQRIIVISGPNAGGKSVCMKTVVLLQYMIQCGLLIPCDVHSTIGIFTHLFVDIGDEQSLENDLSTYSSHLKTMKYMLQHADDTTCVFIDEFGTGTEPLLGGAIAESMLEFLSEKGVFGVITTHYANLKHAAKSLKYCINGAMLFDVKHMSPLFKLRMGQAGSSFAFEIAKTIGISQSILEKAQAKVGVDHVSFDENLKMIETEKQYIFKQKQEIKKKNLELHKKNEEYNAKLSAIAKQKQEIIEQTKQQLDTHIVEANKILEATIREIKEKQAHKESTKQLRNTLVQKQKSLQKSIERIEKKNTPQKSTVSTHKETLAVGAYVVLQGQSVVGEIVSITKKHAHVQFGNVRSLVPLERLSVSTKKPEIIKSTTKSFTQAHIQEKQTNFSTKIDVRGMRTDEALYTIKDFIETAYTLDIKQVLILHGKGYGILREHIRTYLHTENFVESVSDAPIDMGGDGITIVKIQ
ncbi:MAG: Smr/MutS family protein [Bacteroidales bacterium]|nr:Smr/MutS family protein [Bacteroidales bacterium]NLK80637.1 endonuclease MutS2 [Bacteroidales bacterium]